MSIPYAEAALQRCSHENVPGKIPPNPQENNHAEVTKLLPTKLLCSFIEVALQCGHSPTNKSPPPPSPQRKEKTPCTRAPPKGCNRVCSKIQINLK